MENNRLKHLMLLLLVSTAPAAAQPRKALRSTVSYIAGVTVYINAGRLAQVAEGDTAVVFHDGAPIGSAIITAIADSSSAAKIMTQVKPFTIGDTVTIFISIASNELAKKTPTRNSPTSGTSKATSDIPAEARDNVLSGRIALQYSMVAAEDSRLNLSQPAALVQMNIGNLLGMGMSLHLYGVSFLNSDGAYALYGNRSGLQNNFYIASLTGEVPGAGVGYGFGRLSSQFVSGLGSFDGGQLYYRINDFTLGVVGGGAPTVPSSPLGYTGTKTAAFVNYRTGSDVFHQYDGTVAYGLRMRNGLLDRNFLYLQNSLSLGSRLNFYETSEVDMSKLSDGLRVSGLDFSNTFFSMNYYPARWLFANIGYDAYRTVYLFETMKSIPDSLIDRNILQGFRGSVSAYLPGEVTISANASYRTRKDYVRNEHTIGASVRAADLLDLGVEGDIRYTNLYGVYSNGNDVTLELGGTFFDALDVSLSYDSYNISVTLLQQTYSTQTISGFLSYEFSSRLYSSLGLDDVIDPTMNSVRLYTEIGFRF